MYYEPISSIDADKVAELTRDMEQRGWIGEPVVVWGDMLITGTHRQAAARQAGIAMPVIDLADIVGQGTLDEWVAEWGEPLGGWYDVVDAVLKRLPNEIVERYDVQW